MNRLYDNTNEDTGIKTIPMCDMEAGQVAEIVHSGIGNKYVWNHPYIDKFIVLDKPDSYDSDCAIPVRILEKSEKVVVEFFND